MRHRHGGMDRRMSLCRLLWVGGVAWLIGFAAFSSLRADVEAWEPTPPALPLQSIRLTGVTQFNKEFVRLLAPLEGEPYDESVVRKAIDAILAIYHREGFRFARLAKFDVKRFVFGENTGYYVLVRIDEGRIGEIRIRGLQHTREEVIRKQILLQENALFRDDDLEESERILRQKKYIGGVRIRAEADPKTNRVLITIDVKDLWSVLPRFQLVDSTRSEGNVVQNLFDGHVGFQASVRDYNLFGTGQSWRFLYRWETPPPASPEEGVPLRRGRSRIGIEFVEPNLFQSRWRLAASYLQQAETDIDTWTFQLAHPLYSLRSRWAFAFSASETGRIESFRYNRALIRRWEHHLKNRFVRTTLAFGDPNDQVQLSFWVQHGERDSRLLFSSRPVVSFRVFHVQSDPFRTSISPESTPTERSLLFGTSIARQRIRFVRDRNVNTLGRIEDVPLGRRLSLSFGGGLQTLANDHDEIRPTLAYGFLHRFDWVPRTAEEVRARERAPTFRPSKGLNAIWDGELAFSSSYRFRSRLHQPRGWRNIVWTVRSRFFLRKGVDRMLAARLAVASGSRMTEDFNLLLDSRTGIRGYPLYAFDGQHRIVLNLEARQVFWTTPRFVVMGVAFLDEGAIWWDAFTADRVKRSVGGGLRLALKRVSSSPIFRMDLAYKLDGERGWSFRFGQGQYF